MRNFTLRFICLTVLALAFSHDSFAWLDSGKMTFSAKEMDMRTDTRELFSEYLTWERICVLETLTGSADTAKAQERFAASQDNICRVFQNYYGDYTGGQITNLFKQYNQLLSDYLTAAKNRDNKAFVSLNKIYDKAEELANQLSMTNMNWSKDELLSILKKYSDSVTNEIDRQSTNPGTLDTAAVDSTLSNCMDMADTFSAGIIKQFPAKFW